MKALFICSLPFHRWIMGPLTAELWRRGHTVRWFTHWPKDHHDWLHRSAWAISSLRGVADTCQPDLVVAAEYPYGVIRRACRTPVLALRHSLASRRNTWAPEQAQADWICTWSVWDGGVFATRGFGPRKRFLQAGCPWVDPLLEPYPEPGPQAPVLWAPSLNKDLACRDQVTAELRQVVAAGVPVTVRPHAATLWREPEWVRSLQGAGFQVAVSSEMDGPWGALNQAAALVTDVSGIGLLALHARDGRLPVIQVDPAMGARHRWYDPNGPEWTFRDEMGPRLALGEGLAGVAIETVRQQSDPYLEWRRTVARCMVEEGRACPRLVEMLESELA